MTDAIIKQIVIVVLDFNDGGIFVMSEVSLLHLNFTVDVVSMFNCKQDGYVMTKQKNFKQLGPSSSCRLCLIYLHHVQK